MERMDQMEPMERTGRQEAAGRTIQMRRRRSDKKAGSRKRFKPEAIAAGDWILAHDEGWAMRVVGVSQARRRRWGKGGALSSHQTLMTMVELAGECKECGGLHVFRRAVSNIRGPVRCLGCRDRWRERRAMVRDQWRVYLAVCKEARLDGWDFGLEK